MAGNIFVTSDLHLGHKNIIQWTRTQFSSVDEHDQAVIDNWNKVVSKKDTVWILGDEAFGKAALAKLDAMRGYKRLVMGNHDLYSSHAYLKHMNKLYGSIEREKVIFTHVPVHESELSRYRLNVHGHLHDKFINERGQQVEGIGTRHPLYVNVCLEHTQMQPVPLDSIL